MANAAKAREEDRDVVATRDSLELLVTALESHAQDYRITSRALTSAADVTTDYLEYCELKLADEDKFIKPKLVRSFLSNVLGFQSSDITPEFGNTNNRRPDITFAEKELHPFAFEIKGMDSDESDLHDEYVSKSSLYLEDDPDLRFVVITNMREFVVYGSYEGETSRFSRLTDLCFDLREVYAWAKDNRGPREQLPGYVTAFQSFCNIFCCKAGKLTLDQKLEEIFQAPPERPLRTTKKELESEKRSIKNDLFSIINSFVDDLKANHKAQLLHFYESDTTTSNKVDLELGEITMSLKGHVSNFEAQETLAEEGKALLEEYFQKGTFFCDEVDIYFRRVSYFTVFKLLLIRAWEDAQFIPREEWTLYDGGFHSWYHQSNKSIKRVLEAAYGIAKSKYEWLFKENNNYAWYCPSDEFAVNALWRLSKYNFSSLNNDVLGSIYEEHLSLTAKKKIGLFYTHPKVVSLMWDLAGYAGEEGIYTIDSKAGAVSKETKRVLDPCMGSGSFLCEAVRRIIAEAGIYENKDIDLNTLKDLKESILTHFRGVELDTFAFFIAEINVLLMMTPVVKRIQEKTRRKTSSEDQLATGLIPHDSLQFYRNDERNWCLPAGIEAKSNKPKPYKPSNESLIFGRKKDIAKELYDGTSKDASMGFDYCVSNPPYVAEGKGDAKALFDGVKASNPDLKTIYQGKMDYLYWFILLGLSKVREGGKLCYITTAYWPTADGADLMRRTLLENSIIHTVIDFGQQKLFEHAPGQHNLIFLLERSELRRKDQERWKSLRPRVVEVTIGAKFEGKAHLDRLDSLVQAVSRAISTNRSQDDRVKVYDSGKTHNDLLTRSWNLKCNVPEVNLLERLTRTHSSLEAEFCAPKTGIQPGALTVSKKNKEKHFKNDNKVQAGDGILTLASDEARRLGGTSSRFIKPLTKSTDVLSFVRKERDDLYLIYTHRAQSPERDARIFNHLTRFKTILEQKRETKQGKLPWWSNHWPRDPETFESPNLLIPYRAAWNNFAAVDGPVYGLTDMYFVPVKEGNRLRALEAIMNSDLAHFWFAIEGKHKGAQFEFMDFGHFPVPRLAAQQVARLARASEACREAFQPIARLGLCPRTVLHLGFNRDQVPLIDHLKSEVSTLSRFQMKGCKIVGTVSPGATVRSVSRKDATIRVSLSEKGKKIEIQQGTLNQPDFDMIEHWLATYGSGRKWTEVLSTLAFPKSAEALARISKKLQTQIDGLRGRAERAYEDLNQAVFDCYGLEDEDIEIIRNRVNERIEGIKVTGLEVGTDDEVVEKDIA